MLHNPPSCPYCQGQDIPDCYCRPINFDDLMSKYIESTKKSKE